MTAGAIGSPVFDYTSLDFDSAQDDLVRFAQTTFPAELWTDFNESNFGFHLLELMAYATDLLSYSANSYTLETVVTTIIREKNFRKAAKAFDFELKSATPSTSKIRLTLDPGGSYPFTVSKHLQFATKDSIVFQPIVDVAVAAYVPTVDVDVKQGEEAYLENLGTTNGLANQQFSLNRTNLIDGTLSVVVGLQGYSRVTNFIQAGPTEKVYIVETSEDGASTVVFGDGINGTIPPKNQAVIANYFVGGGLETNLPINTIDQLVGTSDGAPVPLQILSLTNVIPATNGGPKQSLANAKQNLPLSLKANDRAITTQDFATLAVSTVPGVLKAIGMTGSFSGGSFPILLAVVPNGGGFPTDALKNTIVTKLKGKKLAGKRIRVVNPVYVDLDIEADLFVAANSPAFVVADRLRAVLNTLYGLEAVDFGSVFSLQSAYDSTNQDKILGVSRILYRRFSVKPYAARHVNRPTTGNGTVEHIATLQDTVQRREWLIRVLPPSFPVLTNRFEVRQRRIGRISGVTDTLITDESAAYVVNELSAGGWTLIPRPADGLTPIPITGNTEQSVSVAAGLLLVAEPDDPYVVEKTEAVVGKVLRTTVTASVSGSATISVASSASFQVGDLVHFSDAPTLYYTVITTAPGTITIDTPISTVTGVFVDYVWQSADGSVRFSMVDGTTPFVPGDEMYVDTFRKSADIELRDENYPLIANMNILINAIGGVR